MELLRSSSILEEIVTSSEIFVFSGPGGTGKSEVAANFSVLLREKGLPCALVDLDFSKGDFTLRSPRFRVPNLLFPRAEKVSYIETPFFAQDLFRLFSQVEEGLRLVVDLGRHEKGLRLFRSLKPFWEKRSTHIVLVVNFARPFFEEVASYVSFVQDIKASYSIPFSSLVANTHLMEETDAHLLEAGWQRTRSLGEVLGLPVFFVSLWEKKKDCYHLVDWGESAVFAISRFLVLPWEEE